ncbi:hypothetical protein AgCh_024428 [Apium graveolens]
MWPIVISSSPSRENRSDLDSSDSEKTLDVVAEKTHLPPSPVPTFVSRDIHGPSVHPRWVRRSLSVVWDFPPGYGPSSSSSRPSVPPSASTDASSPIPYHVHRAVNRGEVDHVAAKISLKEMEKAFALTKMEMEFLELKQEDKSVTEYEAKFTELARIAPEYAALVIESDQRIAAKEKGEKKRKFEEQEGVSQKFQRRFGKKYKDRKFRRQNFPLARHSTTLVSSTPTKFNKLVIDCKTCGKKHSGQCKENVNCFKCGQKGHYATECKSENQGVTCFRYGKVGHIARNSRIVNQGSVGKSVSQGPATSTSRARTFKMMKKSPAQDSDVVARMDWLSLYKANIDYKKKRVVMYTTNNGCEAYLAHVVDTKKETPTLDEIPIVREYPDIFPEELPGLPPDREIEFSIYLIEPNQFPKLHIEWLRWK